MTYLVSQSGTVSLQATLSASSAGLSDMLHHPITCQSKLWLHENGSLECEHHKAEPDDPRTRACIDHTIALLLLEEAHRRFEDGSIALVR